jgi:chromosome partitioning protein
MRTIAVLNQKGGVGKTTTVANTAAALAAAGSKVVAIDLDPQAHLTIHLGIEPQSVEAGSYGVLTQSARLEEQILMVRPNLWLLPANINLVGAESELVSVVGRETILREALQSSEDKFDYCFIDCAPSLGLLTLNALAAAEEVLIPLQPHFLALQGFGQLLQTVELVNKRINPDLTVKGILLCMFDSRASLPNEVKADIEEFLENARGTNRAWSEARILPTFIRRNIKLAEAPSYGKTIFEYEQNCNGAEDYRKVAEFIHAQFQLPAQTQIQQPVVADQIHDSPDSPEPSLPQTPPSDSDENQDSPSIPETSPSEPEQHEPPQPYIEPVREHLPQIQLPAEIRQIPQADAQAQPDFTQTTSESHQAEPEYTES